MSAETTYPATQLVHWPSGPVAACDEHAAKLIALGSFIGSWIVATPLVAPSGFECENCRSEASREPA